MRRRFLQQLPAAALALAAAVRGTPVHAQAPAPVPAPRKPPRIYAVTWRGKTQVENGLEDYFGKQGVAVEFLWRDAEQQTARLAEFAAEIRAVKPDLVYTWGTPPTLGLVGAHDAFDAKRHISGIPVVFALVAAPVGAKLVTALTGHGRDLTGVTHVAALEAQMEAIRTYRPFKKLGMLYNGAERNSVVTAEALKRIATQSRFELIEQTFDRAPDGKPVATGVEDKVAALKRAGAEWLYLGPDTYLFSQIERVANAAAELQLPTFSATEAALTGKAPVLAGLVASYYTIGQFAGFKAEQILIKGKRARDIPIETLSRYSFIVRMDVAKRLDILPPVSLFNYAIMR
ncbi:MAG: ABC transporter substrate-binding protein [Betaproteobacteria bacterium]|nr:ABC transporter substrate-binding protein [Betaproteobacteria bacterium]